MVHHVACCPECGEQLYARDHCPKCNEGNFGSYECPLCKGYILVGKHSIKPDRKRAEKERSENIEAAARKLLEIIGVDDHGGMRPIPIEKQFLDELRDALSR